MSTLAGKQLSERINSSKENEIIITPILDEGNQIKQIGVDCRLGNQFIVLKPQNIESIDLFKYSKDKKFFSIQEEVVVPFRSSFILHPQTLVLGATFEFIGLPGDVAASIEGRSSWARIGLIIATAVTIEPCFKGCITLELANVSSVPIKLYPGMRIAQLICYNTSEKTAYDDKKKYMIPIGPELSKVYKDDDIKFFCES